MKETTADRLKEIMRVRGLKQVDIVEKCQPYCRQYKIKLNRSDLSQYVSGKVEPKQNKLTVLSLALGVSEAWLMGYDVTMENVFIPVPNIIKKKIPLIGTTAAGTPIEAINDNEYVETEINCDCALNVKGDSMVDVGIYDKDIALIKLQNSLDNGQIGVIIINGEVTLKKYYRYENTVVLRPCNRAYEDLVYTLDNIESFRIYGKCVGILRRI